MKIWKSIGHILMGIGIFHVLFALVIGWETWVSIAGDGLFNALGPDMKRQAIFWFMFLGIPMIPMGHMCTWITRRRNAPLPLFVGVHLLVMGAVGAFFVPVSGFWTIVLLGITVILQSPRQTVALQE
ncbi:MAG: hypothetical protein GY757_05700 [bacterium]|nr:hypothetical protein [bacterium]